ncbi:MAG: pspC [Candidatus Acidoferrum typicum]|nr:pspC [Candidatus Acidoferrum typicum]
MTCPNCQKEIVEYSNFCSYCGARQAEAAAANRLGPKRLMRSSTDSKIAGVCGGLAEYFGVDSGIMRIAMTLITIASGFVPGILFYIVAWVILPVAPAPYSQMVSPAAAGMGPASPAH